MRMRVHVFNIGTKQHVMSCLLIVTSFLRSRANIAYAILSTLLDWINSNVAILHLNWLTTCWVTQNAWTSQCNWIWFTHLLLPYDTIEWKRQIKSETNTNTYNALYDNAVVNIFARNYILLVVRVHNLTSKLCWIVLHKIMLSVIKAGSRSIWLSHSTTTACCTCDFQATDKFYLPVKHNSIERLPKFRNNKPTIFCLLDFIYIWII